MISSTLKTPNNLPASIKTDKIRKKRTPTVYKEAEFGLFLKQVQSGPIISWVLLADALGVDPDTVTRWKRTPEALQAIAVGIQHALEQMEEAGSKDWRMWQYKLKLLGVDPDRKTELNPYERMPGGIFLYQPVKDTE